VLIRWALFVYSHAKIVLGFGVVLVLLGGVFGSQVFKHVESNGKDFQDPKSDSALFLNDYARDFPNSQGQFTVLFSSAALRIDAPEFSKDVGNFIFSAKQLPHVTNIVSYDSTRSPKFVSNDRHETFIQISVAPDYQNQTYEQLIRMVSNEKGNVQAKLGGSYVINKQVNGQVEQDLKKAELLSFPILAILLLLFFGSVVSAATPLALGGLSILGAFFIMRLLAEVTTISSYAINVVTLLGLGLSIDYSLFIVGRFREELAKSPDVEVALAVTVNRAGRTILLSGTMVSISLLSLLAFPQTFLRSMGLGGAAVVATCALLSLTLLPAALRLLGYNINALPVFRRKKSEKVIPELGYWYRFSQFVMRRAPIAFTVVVILLVSVALQFRHAKLSTTDIQTVPVSLSSRQVNDELAKNFSGYGSEPVSIILHEPSKPLDPANIVYLQNFTAALQHTAGVARVDSLLSQATSKLLEMQSKNTLVQQLNKQYISGNDTIVTVYQTDPPQSGEARSLVRQLRSFQMANGYSMSAGGVSAQLDDLLQSLRDHVPWVLAIICLATFVLVYLLTGSVVLPVKAILLDLLSLFTALGIVVWVFQRTAAPPLLPLNVLGTVDATSAVLIFAIAFGLSADYEFFLLSRIKEDYDDRRDNTHAIAFGIQKTAGIITAAALLFVSVIGLFLTGKNSLLQQISLGLSAAVIIDATIVRLILVPATMKILGKRNWWAPKPLKNLYLKFKLND
jgi:RND superfamily putative drug exporter